MRPLSSRAFNQRRDDIYSRFDRLGRVELQDLGGNTTTRKLVVDVVVPGQVGEHRLPDDARFRYQEWWRLTQLGWIRVRYDYDYFDLRSGGRRGYHLHPLSGSEPMPHVVCVLPDGSGAGRHFEAVEVDLVAAHEEFEAQYADGRSIDCRGLRSID